MALFFIYDEFTDKVDGDGARVYAEMVMDAIENPYKGRPQGEPKLGEIARQFWLRAIKVSSPAAQRRFIKTFAEYVYAVIDEASDQAGLDIPDEVMAHHGMASLCALAAESLVLTNDMYSYNIEQASGHGGHNIVTVVMNEKGVNLDSALKWLGDYHEEVLARFQAQHRMLPSWGPAVDRDVEIFVERLGYWIRGIDSWSLETERYFGTKGLEIQKHRVVTLLQKVKKPNVTPMMAQPSAQVH
ncbi:isoprenoid synthase domain-containing protein [Multifurca ochricompacta]|uniref:Isoprenoid synthase domain-containing protein n=1 Tax=Multifurca ochricompacta TaxID=376703 RepID=A0AAD4MBT4_9AGAM|nr:isoprenoid synthase domain-containing protein [Multifurca ochricompacta]